MLREPAHQCSEIGADEFGLDYHACGGEFYCMGCERTVGYCRGCGDELGELCDDCATSVVRWRTLEGNEFEWTWWRHPEAS